MVDVRMCLIHPDIDRTDADEGAWRWEASLCKNGLKNIRTVFRGKEANVQCGVIVTFGGCSHLFCDSL